jgi:hypothetical protein
MLDLLDFIIASKEDARSVMDMLRDNLKHAAHVAIESLTTS